VAFPGISKASSHAPESVNLRMSRCIISLQFSLFPKYFAGELEPINLSFKYGPTNIHRAGVTKMSHFLSVTLYSTHFYPQNWKRKRLKHIATQFHYHLPFLLTSIQELLNNLF